MNFTGIHPTKRSPTNGWLTFRSDAVPVGSGDHRDDELMNINQKSMTIYIYMKIHQKQRKHMCKIVKMYKLCKHMCKIV